MRIIPKDVWTRLAADKPSQEVMWARMAAPDISKRLVAAVDSSGERHLLIPLEDDEPDAADRQSRGITLMTRELAIPGHPMGRYLDIVCHDASGHGAFDLIGGEIAEALAGGAEPAPKIAARVLAKWRRFWGQMPMQMLSREEQIGLFAELWFLSVWLAPCVGFEEAVMRWRGPRRSRHDFEWTGQSIEVKATLSLRGQVHRINGLDQLAPPDHGELCLFSLCLREEGGATNTLPAMLKKCQAALQGTPAALDQFESSVSLVGYSPVYEEDYAKLRLHVVRESLFRVDNDFPRLTSSNIVDGLSAGIERVEYDINLAGYRHLEIASAPTMWGTK